MGVIDKLLDFGSLDLTTGGGTGIFFSAGLDFTPARNLGAGEPLYVACQVTAAPAAGTSIIIDLITDDDAANFGSGSSDHGRTPAMTIAQLTVGKRFDIPFPSVPFFPYEEILGLRVSRTGTFNNGGAIRAWVTNKLAFEQRA